MKKIIDLRSDTVTQPSEAMRSAMRDAKVGDDVYGEDPTVNLLQDLAAELTGMEAALFVPTGTQGNLLAILSHCQRGDEYIAGQQAHCYRYEAGGAAVCGGVQPQPLEFEADGTLDLDKVADAIKPADHHFAVTRLLCLENTQAGRVLPLDYQSKAAIFVKKHNIKLHLDGARVFNASVKLQIPLNKITRHYDSVAFCLSKGLGAPVGSVLTGTRDFIGRAHRWRKMTGGGMRQAGILAEAGIYALENNVKRLVQDHENALLLAENLAKIEELKIDLETVQTNMVFFRLRNDGHENLVEFLKGRGILAGGYGQMRMVTHHDIDASDISIVVDAIKEYFAKH